MIRRFLAPGAALSLVCAGCTEPDDSKLKPRPFTWNEDLLFAVMARDVPSEPRYPNGDKSPQAIVSVVCAKVGRDDPSPRLLKRLSAGRIPVVGGSRCAERPEEDDYFEASSGRPASYIRIDRVACIDDLLCKIAVSGRYGGSESWWRREIVGGWEEVPGTAEMTWIS